MEFAALGVRGPRVGLQGASHVAGRRLHETTALRVHATAAAPDGAFVAGEQQAHTHTRPQKEARQAETARRIAEARQRVAAAQQRIGRALAASAAAGTSSVALARVAAAALDAPAASADSHPAAAALARAHQEAAKADEAVAAVAAAVAGEAHRQQALLDQMRGQLAALQRTMGDSALSKAAVPVAAAPAQHLGASLSVASVSGAGRQLLVATGRVVAAAAVATAASEQARTAAQPPMHEMQGRRLRPALPPRQPHTAQHTQQAGKQRRSWSPVDLLLAPMAPLLRSFRPAERGKRSADSSAGASSTNTYDLLLELLASLAAGPEQADARYEPLRHLLAQAPAAGTPRYEFARSVLRGLVSADAADSGSPFGLASSLLQRAQGGEEVPDVASRYPPVWRLLKEAALLEEWGPPAASKYDPLAGLSDWADAPAAVPHSRYCPWSDVSAAVRAWEERGAGVRAVPSKYDPWAGVAAAARDPTWLGPTGGGKYCPVAAALDAAAGWEAPAGHHKYCPVSSARQAAQGWEGNSAEDQAGQPAAWLLGLLLDGWAANSHSWEAREAGAAGEAASNGGAVYQYA